MSRVVVIGGGPAGMFAAIAAAENGHHVPIPVIWMYFLTVS